MPPLQPLGLLKENCAESAGSNVVVVSEFSSGTCFGKPRNDDPRGSLGIFTAGTVSNMALRDKI